MASARSRDRKEPNDGGSASELGTAAERVLDGELMRILGVVNARASARGKELRASGTTDDAAVLGDTLRGYDGLLTGRPVAIDSTRR
jgi:hypothetical protein